MGILKNEYKSFLDDIEKNIKDKESLEYTKQRFTKFLDIILEQMDNIKEYKEEKIEKIEKSQKEIESKIDKMQQILDNIEKDIYSEDGFDFEIICPYCNYEFLIDVNENKTEIECPECQNIIELDWSGDPDGEGTQKDDNCAGHCGGCPGCGNDKQDEDDDM